MSITFEAQVQQIGDRLIVRLPGDASAALPSRGQVAVDAELNGHLFRTVLEPDGRKGHWIAVDAALQDALSLSEGVAVAGELTPTKAWPEPEVPGDLGSALDDAADLDDTWDSLTPMARWEWVRWVKATKNPETRERRVEVSISKLRDGKRRPCCFDLSSCTDPEVAKSGKLIEPS
ncbi:YdeI/OmpD-associated family protein [Ammonicoccus fulvus]|uniref:YdeI/OmpD-associated family protein n=1 Tax=Ammonicoccus fulvus TaxID=3138240 RepID=A0ABZ3FRK4_9ACTN